MSYGVTESGFNRKSFTEIKESLEERAKTLFGNDVDLSKTSPLMKLINSSALELARMWDSAELIYSSAYIDQASGINLERIAKLVGVQRQTATFSVGEATFYGDNDVKVPKGFTISTENSIMFETTQSGVIGQKIDGEVILDIKALESGEYSNVPAETITKFVDNKNGIISVKNVNSTSGGENVETDASLRTRVKSILNVRANATKTAIENTVLNIDGVTSVTLNENDDISIELILGGLGAKSELTQDKKDEIDKTINDVRAYGIPYVWDTPTQITINVGGGGISEDDYSTTITGNVTDSTNLFDNDTSTVSTYNNTGEYVEIDIGEIKTMTDFKYYGNSSHDEDGYYKIQYYDSESSSWIDLVSNISTRADSWSDWIETDYVESQKFRIVSTTIDSNGSNIPAEFTLRLGATKVYVDKDYPDKALSKIESRIYDYINELDVAEDVIYTKLYDVIYNAGDWVYNIKDLEMGDISSGTLGTADVSIGSTEKATTTMVDIFINMKVR